MNLNKAEFIAACALPEQLPASELGKGELVVCGRSNVGKSSLINRLCGRKSLARVSATPGKTSTINFFSLDVNGCLVDLPGYGYAKRSLKEKARWKQLIEYYFLSERNIRGVLLLLDIRHDPSAEDIMMLEFLRRTNMKIAVVLTKSDKLSRLDIERQKASFIEALSPYKIFGLLPFSTKNLKCKDELQAFIENLWEHEAGV